MKRLLLIFAAVALAGCVVTKPSHFATVKATSGKQELQNSDVPNTWPEGSWKRHTIDDSSFGADGIRFGDINGDGLLDITTPWEEGGQVRVYINPGKNGLKDRWPGSSGSLRLTWRTPKSPTRAWLNCGRHCPSVKFTVDPWGDDSRARFPVYRCALGKKSKNREPRTTRPIAPSPLRSAGALHRVILPVCKPLGAVFEGL